MNPSPVLEWLLEAEQPSVRYRTLTQVLGRPENDPEVIEARRRIPEVGWVAEILSERKLGGWWGDGTSLYRPKYLSTNWKLLVLADLGVTRETPGIEESAELWMSRFASRDGAFGVSPSSGHLCVAGNTARALVQFGFGSDPRVRSAFEWLAKTADPKGGWSCFGSGRNLDSWEGLSAFAVYPRAEWSPAMREAVERSAEFFLERELHRQGDRYEPWFRFHYPVHYYYDLLVGLDLLTALGYGGDPRLAYALSVLADKRRPDGRWAMDALHPDVEGGIAEWFAKHPRQRPTPWGLETPGRPSKMITLRALTVLARLPNGRSTDRRHLPSSAPPSSRRRSTPKSKATARLQARTETTRGSPGKSVQKRSR
jgi:hypothetical protein